jgi:hypothetical protein
MRNQLAGYHLNFRRKIITYSLHAQVRIVFIMALLDSLSQEVLVKKNITEILVLYHGGTPCGADLQILKPHERHEPHRPVSFRVLCLASISSFCYGSPFLALLRKNESLYCLKKSNNLTINSIYLKTTNIYNI